MPSTRGSSQECWSGLPRPPPGDLPDPGIKDASLASPALAGGIFITGATWKALLALLDPFNNKCVCDVLSCFRPLEILWTIDCQAPLSVGFSRQEYWGGLPFPSPEDLPNLGTKPMSPAWQADSLPLSYLGSKYMYMYMYLYMYMYMYNVCSVSSVVSDSL